MTPTFDPWDWLGISCGGFFSDVDVEIICLLEALRDDDHWYERLNEVPQSCAEYRRLICTFLCNTDAFEFDGDPTSLRFVGDEQFKTIDALIEAWDEWYGRHYR